MVAGKYDPVTKKVVFPKAGEGGDEVDEDSYVTIPKETADKLAAFAKADGADMSAETARGRKGKLTRAIAPYVLGAVAELINARKK